MVDTFDRNKQDRDRRKYQKDKPTQGDEVHHRVFQEE